jgi:hypothetical protein
MSVDCSLNASSLSGFKWYDFNGYQSSYDRSVTYSKASVLPGGYWRYVPDEDLGISADLAFEYAKWLYRGRGALEEGAYSCPSSLILISMRNAYKA